MRPEPLIIAKANLKSRIHRRVYMDYVGIKRYGENGRLAGEIRLVGLFTSTAYTSSTTAIPYLSRKMAHVLARAGFDRESHSGKALANVLESYPRDELFQVDEETLFTFALAILALGERPRVRVLARRDKFDRFVSVIVFVPRDRYDSGTRTRIAAYLADVYDGHISAYYPAFPEGPLARVHFIIGRAGGPTPDPSQATLEEAVAAIARTWSDGLEAALRARHDPARAAALAGRYGNAFPPSYRDDFPPETAIADIDRFERLTTERPIAGEFRPLPDGGRLIALRLVHLNDPITLSARVPMLENMRFEVIDERTYEIAPAEERPRVWLHDMTLDPGAPTDLGQSGPLLLACFMAVWYGLAENDGLNGLTITAGLAWRDVALLRTVSRYIRQAGTSYSQDYMAATLVAHGELALALVELFHSRLAPGPGGAAPETWQAKIAAGLDAVQSLDEDRIIRRFANVITAIVRTNFFQPANDGAPHAEISIKLDAATVDGLPAPRPFREIFVHSPRIDGIHLRFGRIARGGIRWSDRPEDFRTEILGLAKAQQVKNAVIVPVGAKGGFVPKKLPPSGRDGIAAEGLAAYRTFVSSLLDITDNLEGGHVVAPAEVVRHEEDDPYLVVAADKGTATFSDTANALSAEHGYWLGDAFASGGSAGYDHKKMGITARGAFVAIERHFREMDVDITTTPFTAVGVGDMSGDVFGNGMLLAPTLQLLAAFDHRDIFIDPNPDPVRSLAERLRLFDLPRSSWQDYDRAAISPGGGVFSRREKAIRLSREARTLLGLAADQASPPEIITAILKARADLLFFGGIGTFVRGSRESDHAVGDRANDAVRITAAELRVRVVGEGANLGMTPPARIEFGLAGGRCNSDAIDNSAGVNTSDVEVNIKIALGAAIHSGKLDLRRRNRLLAAMTDEVAGLVLRNNYLQTLAISLAQRRGFEDFDYQRRLMQELEGRGLLDRRVETLPDDSGMAERRVGGQPLTRAEIGVLLAHAKLALAGDLVASDVVDDPLLASELVGYFPKRMRKPWRAEIEGHRLRREIIATALANSVINRGGPTCLVRLADRARADAAHVARAYVAVRDAFALDDLNGAIDALDGKVAGAVQLDLYRAVQDLLLAETAWFLDNASFAGGLEPVVKAYRGTVATLARFLDDVLPAPIRERATNEASRLTALAVPDPLAQRIARLPMLAQASNIHLVVEATEARLKRAASLYFAVGAALRIGEVMSRAGAVTVADAFDRRVLDRALARLAGAHRRLAIQALATGADDPLSSWRADTRESVERTLRALGPLIDAGEPSVSRFAVAAELLEDLAGTGAKSPA
jgi:glutamate dehydrogenase